MMHQLWPFQPANIQTPEQRQQWWQDCFVPLPEVNRFLQAPASAVLIGGSGSGKSTAIATLYTTLAESTLLIPYLPHHWPSGTRPWVPKGNHLSQILAAAAAEISHKLSQTPELYTDVCHNKHQQQFFFWLVEKYLSRRALVRLLHRLRQSLDLPIAIPDTPESLYETTTHETDVWNQLDELVSLAQMLKFEQIIVTIDLNEMEAKSLQEDLRNLFGWLDLFEYPEFVIRAAIPQSVVQSLRLAQQINGRLELITLSPTDPIIQNIVSRHLRVSTYGAYSQLHELVSPAILQRVQTEIQQLYNGPAVAGWLQWTEALLITANQQIPMNNLEQITLNFYRHHMPLRLDTIQPGVWRGPQFIRLDQQLYEFLGQLFALQGQPNLDLLQDFAGSKEYLNKLASRLRKEIEPLSGDNIYLQNRRDQGYWLENFLI